MKGKAMLKIEISGDRGEGSTTVLVILLHYLQFLGYKVKIDGGCKEWEREIGKHPTITREELSEKREVLLVDVGEIRARKGKDETKS